MSSQRFPAAGPASLDRLSGLSGVCAARPRAHGAIRGRRLLALALIALMILPLRVESSGGGLRLVAMMPSGSTASTLRLIVDPSLNVGAAVGPVAEDGQFVGTRLILYDLETLEIAGMESLPISVSPERAVVDPTRHRILFTPGIHSVQHSGCAAGPQQRFGISAFSLPDREWEVLTVPCTGTEPAADQFVTLGLSHHAASDRVYAVGGPQTERSIRSTMQQHDRAGQPLLLRQMNAETMALEWEIDLRTAGCATVNNAGVFGPFVQRHDDNIISYCYTPAIGSVEGAQGYAVRIPLEGDAPVLDAQGLPVVHLTPTLPNALNPMLDTGSGELLLLTVGQANGDAVWVFDPIAERFRGVIATGVVGQDRLGQTVYTGFDETLGRAYLLSSAGILVADTRHEPLPSGINVPLLRDLHGQGSGPFIAVAPDLRRLFIPVAGEGFAVIEDTASLPPAVPAPDPDVGTADVAEQEGRTGRTFSGAASAYGTHVLNTGGLTAAGENIDPFCYSPLLRQFAEDERGRCLAAQAFTSGNREMFAARTATDAGSETGAFATAATVGFPSSDSATDSDLRRARRCFDETIEDRADAEIPGSYRDACDAAHEQLGAHTGFDLSGGTAGVDGEGFPVPRSDCLDFGDGRDESRYGGGDDPPRSLLGASRAKCDAAGHRGEAAATAGAVFADGLVAVGETHSEVQVELTDEGVVATARAVATGITIGPLTIGRIESVARTVARGQSGTTGAAFTRTISDVYGPGIACAICSEEEVTAAINRAAGVRIRAALPEPRTLASPRGYQALVQKETLQRASERALNNDDTFEVAGLQVVVYNDGRFGRSRLVLQFAGVRAETRYGIYLLPEAGELDPPAPPPPPAATVAGARFAAPPPPPPPGALEEPQATGPEIPIPVRQVVDGLRLLVNSPRDFLLLFTTWALLALPVYLFVRRRSWATMVGR